MMITLGVILYILIGFLWAGFCNRYGKTSDNPTTDRLVVATMFWLWPIGFAAFVVIHLFVHAGTAAQKAFPAKNRRQTVVFVDFSGESITDKAKAIKRIREILGYGLEDARAFVEGDGVDKPIYMGLHRNSAKRQIENLAEYGIIAKAK